MTSPDPTHALRERLREVLAGKFVAPGKHYLVSETDLKEVLEALASPALGETAGKEADTCRVCGRSLDKHEYKISCAGSSRDTEGR